MNSQFNARHFALGCVFLVFIALIVPQINYYYVVTAAKAKAQSAVLEANAEVARANGLASANNIIGESLRGKEEYLRYLFIQTMKDGNSERIYIPTEAGMPILEARPSLAREK